MESNQNHTSQTIAKKIITMGGGVPKNSGTPQIIHFNRVINHPFGVPLFLETPMCHQVCTYCLPTEPTIKGLRFTSSYGGVIRMKWWRKHWEKNTPNFWGKSVPALLPCLQKIPFFGGDCVKHVRTPRETKILPKKIKINIYIYIMPDGKMIYQLQLYI